MTSAIPALPCLRRAACVAIALLACTAASAAEGLRPPDDTRLPWSRWQARLTIDTTESTRWGPTEAREAGLAGLRGLSLMGDYVFARALGENGHAHALRATSGVIFGQRSSLWLGAPGQATHGGFAIDRRRGSALSGSLPGSEQAGSLPYVGIGYSALSRQGWHFSADFGLLATGSTNPVRLGRALASQGADELLHEMRLSPVLQFGASYAF